MNRVGALLGSCSGAFPRVTSLCVASPERDGPGEAGWRVAVRYSKNKVGLVALRGKDTSLAKSAFWRPATVQSEIQGEVGLTDLVDERVG